MAESAKSDQEKGALLFSNQVRGTVFRIITYKITVEIDISEKDLNAMDRLGNWPINEILYHGWAHRHIIYIHIEYE